MAEVFEKNVRTINEHIKTIYKTKELIKNSTVRKFQIVQQEGNRKVKRNIEHYNLDMIIYNEALTPLLSFVQTLKSLFPRKLCGMCPNKLSLCLTTYSAL